MQEVRDVPFLQIVIIYKKKYIYKKIKKIKPFNKTNKKNSFS